jgi:CubicO group peptidase (beta-lactamase class C family)
VRTVEATAPRPWPVEPRAPDAVQIAGAGRMLDLDEFLTLTHTTAFVVAVDGTIVAERYFRGTSRTDRLIGYSATKSALALLVGAAQLPGVDDPAVKFVPELAGTPYETATVRHLLSMTTGVDWLEDHRDPSSPAVRLHTGSVRAQLLRIPGGRPPGTAFTYCTADSLVLDWVRERATGLDFATHLGRLWTAIGAEHAASVGVDDTGVARAGGALSATARDWAKLGALQFDGGNVVSRAWVEESSRPGLPFLRPGRLPSTITGHAGFGYHWWPLDEAGGRVMADGMRGQMVYVDRTRRVVVVKMSNWPFEDAWADRQFRDLCYLALPAIARVAADAW